ncbi:MAG: tRNA dihydrouridine synthase DusB [Ilumatobacteraceae bacterium]
MLPLRIGDFTPAAPVVLAPMAGVTNRAFRTMCRTYGPDLVYVNEMVMSTAVVYRNAKTLRMMSFGPDESPRSLQLYGSDPDMLGRAVHAVCDEQLVDHIDLNFGCPAAKVTRKGGGAAVPAKPRLLRAILRAAVGAAAPYGVPVTAKFRMGLWDDLRTDVTTGRICAEEGVAWIALHARTVQQHYSGEARWDAIGELKQAVGGIPVLGNGDIWEANDAVEMMRATGCDGVVIGRGCLGRPWLFGDLVSVLNGGPLPASRDLGEVVDAMTRHARLLVDHFAGYGGEDLAMRDFRKHTAWYMSGYPVGPAVRRELAMISSIDELDAIVDRLDRSLRLVEGGERIKRGHTNGPVKVSLPVGYLDDTGRDGAGYVVPDDADVMALSGG